MSTYVKAEKRRGSDDKANEKNQNQQKVQQIRSLSEGCERARVLVIFNLH